MISVFYYFNTFSNTLKITAIFTIRKDGSFIGKKNENVCYNRQKARNFLLQFYPF